MPVNRVQTILGGVWCILILGGCAHATGSPGQDGSATARDDSVALAVARRGVDAAPLVGALWPGFWPVEQGFVLMPFRGGALLVARDQAPGSLPPAGDDLPASLRGIAFLLEHDATAGSAWSIDLAYEVRGRRYPAVGVLDDSVPDREQAVLTFLYHEAFHAYQLGRFQADGAAPPASRLGGPTAAERVDGAVREVERRLLSAALSPDGDSAAAALRAYMGLRARRMAGLSRGDRDRELSLERVEGSAHLVGHQAAHLAMGRRADAVGATLRHELDALVNDGEREPLDEYRDHLYRSGAALGLVLDRRAVRWRGELETGHTFWALLERHFGPVDLPEAEVAGILAMHGYEESLQARHRAAPWTDPLAEFESRPGFRVIVSGMRIANRRSVGRFDRYDHGTTIYRAGAQLEMGGPGVEWVSHEHPVLIRSEGPTERVEVVLPVSPLVRGVRDEADNDIVRGLELRAPGLSVTIRGPARLFESNNELHVDIAAGTR